MRITGVEFICCMKGRHLFLMRLLLLKWPFEKGGKQCVFTWNCTCRQSGDWKFWDAILGSCHLILILVTAYSALPN